MVASLQQDRPSRDLALTATHTAYIYFLLTAHMMQNNSILTVNAFGSNATIATAGKTTFKAATQSQSTVKMSGGQKSLRLKGVLHVAGVEQSPFPVSHLFDDGQTVEFSNRTCVVKKKNSVVRVDERVGGMYSIKLQLANEKELLAPEDNRNMLSEWHSRLVHADHYAIRNMAQSNAVHRMDMTIPLVTSNCSPCVERTIRNASVKSRTILERWLGAVVHTDVAEVNVTSVERARYFVMFLYEASGHLGACHMITKEKPLRWKNGIFDGSNGKRTDGGEDFSTWRRGINERFRGVRSGLNRYLYNCKLHS